MDRRSVVAFAAYTTFLLTASGSLGAQPTPSASDTPAAAKAMLERAVQAVKSDKQKALTAFTQGTGGFHQGDLYVFCIGADGKIDAHPNAALLGVDVRTLTDKNGKRFGEEMLQVAQEGQFAEVTYSWPRLLTNEPIPKTSFVTKVADQICGVGYYK